MKKIIIVIVLVIFGVLPANPKPKPFDPKGRIETLEVELDCLRRDHAITRSLIEDFIRSSN